MIEPDVPPPGDARPRKRAREPVAGLLERNVSLPDSHPATLAAAYLREHESWDGTSWREQAQRDERPGAARALADDHGSLLRCWRGDWYRWHEPSGCYLRVPRDQLDCEIRLYLARVRVPDPDGDGEIDLRVTRAVVTEVLAALPSLGLAIPDAIEPPCRLALDGPRPVIADLMLTRRAYVSLLEVDAPGRLMPCWMAPDPAVFATSAIQADWDQVGHQPPAWLDFLARAWPGDQQSIDALQEWFGYLLTADTRLQKALLLVGPPRSGKGTIARVLRALIGAQHCAGPTLSSLQTQFGLQSLIGARLAIVSDARLSGRADQAEIVERLLSITGEDAVTIDRKFASPITVRLGTRIMILTNELPSLGDASGALASRFLVLELTQSHLGEEDLDLEKRLLAELPGILTWAIHGWQSLCARGRFFQPASALDAVDDLGRLSAPIAAFLADVCEVVVGAETSVEQLYGAWCAWCKDEGREHTGTRQSLARALRAAARVRMVRRQTPTGKRVRFYVGVRLREED